MTRVGEWMQTYTGRAFWPLDPRPEEVFLEDIAHSLSMQCRYAGHCLRFYSVAEHCWLMTRHMLRVTEGLLDDHARRNAARVMLLHDAPEAYLVDLPRPVKRHIPDYVAAEAKVWRAIQERFQLTNGFPSSIKNYDNAILIDEMQQNMADPPMDWDLSGEPLGLFLQYFSPYEAKSAFLELARELGLEESTHG